jgi:DNA repair exonuclease SbcCD ATPase subunit
MIDYRKKYIELETRYNLTKERLDKNVVLLSEQQKNINVSLKCREIVNNLANETITDLLSWIEDTVTSCIEQVYYGYSFKFKQEIKRNQLELKPVIIKDGQERPPDYSNGGGMLDLISIALRVANWAIQKEKSLPIFILDEPMKYMGVFSEKGAQVLDQLSKKMNLQFIIITHNKDLVESFENPNIFEFSNNK